MAMAGGGGLLQGKVTVSKDERLWDDRFSLAGSGTWHCMLKMNRQQG